LEKRNNDRQFTPKFLKWSRQKPRERSRILMGEIHDEEKHCFNNDEKKHTKKQK